MGNNGTNKKQNEHEAILVSEFIKKYEFFESDMAKKKYAESIVVSSYAPVSIKRFFLENLVNKSAVELDNGMKYIDMFTAKVNLVGVILLLYTNLELDKDEDGNPLLLDAYDSLMKNGIMDVIYTKLGEAEINELVSVQQSVMDNFHQQNTTTQGFVANILNRFADKIGVAAGFAVDRLEKLTHDEKAMEKLGKSLRNGITNIMEILAKKE